MIFEWDAEKAEKNFNRHKVTFAEAAAVFGDMLSITFYDPDHSKNEYRYITIGWSNLDRLIMVAHTERGDQIRIISARKLTKKERQVYEEGN